MSVIMGLIVSSTTEYLFDCFSENFLFLSKKARTKLAETFFPGSEAYKRCQGSRYFYIQYLQIKGRVTIGYLLD